VEMPPVALQCDVSILVENMWHLENVNLLPTETILYFHHGVLSLPQPRHSCKWSPTILSLIVACYLWCILVCFQLQVSWTLALS